MRKFAALLGALLLAVTHATTTAASGGQVIIQRGQPVEIAVVFPHSGPLSGLGASARNAVQMALEKHSRIRGFDVQLNDFDGPCGPGAVAANAAAASAVVSNAQNVAVIGHFCSPGFAAALQTYEIAGVVTLSGSANNPTLPSFGPDVFNSLVFAPDSDFQVWYATVVTLPSDVFWQQRYQDEFGAPPGPFADLYYDAMSVMLDQIAAAATLDQGSLVIDRAALAQAVRTLADSPAAGFKGVTCSITLGSDGFRVNDPVALAKCASTGLGA